jgi:hypothetical protein
VSAEVLAPREFTGHDKWRLEHLLRDQLARPDDPYEILRALLDLRELGCREDDMHRAADLLRCRPSVGEWLVVANHRAQRYYHACHEGPKEYRAARVVWVEPAEVVES